MEDHPLDEEEKSEVKKFHCSVNFFHKKNNLSIEEDKKIYRKRSSSISINVSKNYAPKIKPKKTVLCPSPIKLYETDIYGFPPETQNTTISTISLDSQNDFSLKNITKINYRKKKPQKPLNVLNIEEEICSISDYGENSKKAPSCSDSETSDSFDDKLDNNKNNNKISILDNINLVREKMAKIKRKIFSNDNLYDDLDIKNCFTGESINKYNIISKIRKNKILISKPFKMIKYKTKSFSIQQRYVSTILGFLEKIKSTNSLNLNGK